MAEIEPDMGLTGTILVIIVIHLVGAYSRDPLINPNLDIDKGEINRVNAEGLINSESNKWSLLKGL